MTTSRIAIVNNALAELGQTALTGLSDAALSAEVQATVYDTVYEALLGRVPWRFAMRKAQLSREVAVPLNEWSYQFVLPAQCLRVVATYPNISYEIYEQKLFANTTELAIDYIHKVTEAALPATYAVALHLKLAAAMCMALTQDKELKKELDGKANMQLAVAMSSDAMQRPNAQFRDAPFVNVRMGG